MTWEDYRDAVQHCREIICEAKAQLELKLASTVEGNKKDFKYINSKRSTRENIGPLLDEDGHLTNRDIHKVEIFNAFFVFNTDDGGPGTLSCRTVTVEMINSQPIPNLWGIYYSNWMHVSLWGLMGFIPGYSKSWLMLL